MLFATGGPPSLAQSRRMPPTAASESARAYRSDRAALTAAQRPEACQAIADKIAKAHPLAVDPGAATHPPDRLAQLLESDPETAFREATPGERNSMFRLLHDDALQRFFELRAVDTPQDVADLAQAARKRLPDRPDLPVALLDVAAKSLPTLHHAEVENLARAYEQAGRPNGARDLRRRWLDDQREHRLGPDDADGRVSLAAQYRSILGDDATAATLLLDAYRIDKDSPSAASALLALNYRKEGDRWVAPGTEAEPAGNDATPATAAPANADGSPIGFTRDQVRAKMGGPPARMTRIATQGRIIEQWSYELDRGSRRIFHFQKRGPRSEPLVRNESFIPSASAP